MEFGDVCFIGSLAKRVVGENEICGGGFDVLVRHSRETVALRFVVTGEKAEGWLGEKADVRLGWVNLTLSFVMGGRRLNEAAWVACIGLSDDLIRG